MPPAFTFTRQSRVRGGFVDILPVQIGKPCLDVPCGNKYRHAFTCFSGLLACFHHDLRKLCLACQSVLGVAVNDNDQRLLHAMLP